MEYQRDFKGIWIPKEIWLSEDLNIAEKNILAEINSLDGENGCFASNDYFADFFKLSKRSISRYISSLQNKGYIAISFCYKDGKKEIEKRIIRTIGMDKNDDRVSTDLSRGYGQFCPKGIAKNGVDITKEYNIAYNKVYIDNENFSNFHLQKQKNKSQEIEETKPKEEHSQKSEENKNYIAAIGQSSKTFLDIFKSEITESFIEMLKVKYKLTSEEIKEIANNFILYRTEQNLKGTKQKRQMEKTFDVKRRFYTRLNNEQKYNKRPQDTTGVVIIG